MLRHSSQATQHRHEMIRESAIRRHRAPMAARKQQDKFLFSWIFFAKQEICCGAPKNP
jgi:hypothetical protein